MPTTLKEVPIKIKTHLGSDEIIGVIDRLNNNARIFEPRTIPLILFKLITKILAPEKIYEQILKDLNFSEEKTKAITREIKEKILEPIKDDLKKRGIDIDVIDTKNSLLFHDFLKKEKEELQKFGISFEIIEEPEPIKRISLDKIGEAPMAKKIPIEQTENFFSNKQDGSPLIIHQVKPLTETKPKTSTPLFSLPFKFLKSKLSQRNLEKPVMARIETPEKTMPEPEENQASKRVVHYSGNRTPFSPAETPDFINLEKLSPDIPAPPSPPTPKKENAEPKTPPPTPKTTEIDDKNKPKLDGNIVDLS
ncbi:MAG: hypothetical protein QMD65_00320 [Patescibacteria group bacterium]|nr:hypothetical protein [Patescibacteria group bacterium]